jgi:hypothetical protein
MLEQLFGPLDRKYCEFFYIMAVVQFVLLVVSVGSLVFLLSDYKKNKLQLLMTTSHILTLGFVYFYNRLLYTMCLK